MLPFTQPVFLHCANEIRRVTANAVMDIMCVFVIFCPFCKKSYVTYNPNCMILSISMLQQKHTLPQPLQGELRLCLAAASDTMRPLFGVSRTQNSDEPVRTHFHFQGVFPNHPALQSIPNFPTSPVFRSRSSKLRLHYLWTNNKRYLIFSPSMEVPAQSTTTCNCCNGWSTKASYVA